MTINIQSEQVGFLTSSVLYYLLLLVLYLTAWPKPRIDSHAVPSMPMMSLDTLLVCTKSTFCLHGSLETGEKQSHLDWQLKNSVVRECVLLKAKYSQTWLAWNKAQIFSFFKGIQPTLLRSSLLFRFKMGFCNGFEMTDWLLDTWLYIQRDGWSTAKFLICVIYSSENFQERKLHNLL